MKYIYLQLVGMLMVFGSLHTQAQNLNSDEYLYQVNDTLAVFNLNRSGVYNVKLGTDHSGSFDIDLTTIDTYNNSNTVYIYNRGLGTQNLIGTTPTGTAMITGGDYYHENVQNLAISNTNQDQTRIMLSWNTLQVTDGQGASHDAQNYLLFRKELNAGEDINTAWDQVDYENMVAFLAGDVTQYLDTDLKIMTSYAYRILAISDITSEFFITDYSEVAVGTTAGPKYTTTALNEYQIKHDLDLNYDIYTSFEKEELHFIVKEQNEELFSTTSGFTSHLSEEATLWEQALNVSSEGTNYISGQLPSEFTSHIEDWTVEMIVRIKELNQSGSNKIYDNGNDLSIAFEYVDGSKSRLVINGIAVDREMDYEKWTSLSFVYRNDELMVYLDGQLVEKEEIRGLLPIDGVNNNNLNAPQVADNIEVGMIRAWNVARTADQIADDDMDLYNPGDNPAGLYDQWVMYDPAYADVYGLNNKVLAWTSTDPDNYPLTWAESFALKDETMITLTEIHHVEPATSHNYTLDIYEVGSGVNHHSDNGQSASTSYFSTNPVLAATNNHSGIDLTFETYAVAEEFKLQRSDGTDTVELMTFNAADTTLEESGVTFYNTTTIGSNNFYFNGENGDLVGEERKLIIHYSDEYTDEMDSNTILGGRSYTYSMVPFYQETGYDDKTAQGLTLTSISSTDLNVNAQANNNTGEIMITWNDTNLIPNFGSDTVRISRDRDEIAQLVGANSYVDDDAVYGETHTYGVHVWRDGQQVFAQYANDSLTAIGQMEGWILSKNEFVLTNTQIELSSTDANDMTLTSGSDGTFRQTGISFDDEATFTTTVGDELTLTRERPVASSRFLHLDSVAVAKLIFRPIGINKFQVSGAPMANVQKLYTQFVLYEKVDRNIFIQIFRDEELISIEMQTTNGSGMTHDYFFFDTGGISGQTYLYKVRASFYDTATEQFFYCEKEISAVYPDTTPINNLSAVESDEDQFLGTNDAMKLGFDYAVNSDSDQFEVYRSVAGSSTFIQIGSADSISTDGINNRYEFIDYTGVPYMSYDYYVNVVSGENISQSNVVENVVYPLEEGAFAGWGLTVSNVLDYHRIKITIDSDLSQLKNFDGFTFMTNNRIFHTVSTKSYTYTGTAYDYEVNFYYGLPDEDLKYDVYLYKINEEGTAQIYIPLDIATVSQATYPNTYAGISSLTGIAYDGFYKATWEPPATKVHKFKALGKNNNAYLETLDQNKLSWVTSFETGDPNMAKFRGYNSSNTNLHTVSTNLSSIINLGTTGFGHPQNIQASQDLSEGVFVQWEYPDFSDAEFVIYRDGMEVDTVANQTWYYDQELDSIKANEEYAYQVQAIYDEDKDGIYEHYSRRELAIGMRRVHFTVEGIVQDQNGLGVPNITLKINHQQAITDSTGYYIFDELYYEQVGDGAYNLVMRHPLKSGLSQQTSALEFDEGSPRSVYNFTIDGYSYHGLKNINEVANVFAITGYPNANDLSVTLRIQLTEGDYDGVELYRGIGQIIDLTSLDNLVFDDQTGLPGETYGYTAISYIEDRKGNRTYGRSASISVTMPGLAAPAYFRQYLDNGEVNLVWAHANEDLTYVINRNDESLAKSNDRFFTDESGIPNDTYRYKIYAEKSQRDGSILVSKNYNELTVTYPFPEEVTTLSVVSDTQKNTVDLSWTVDASADIQGFTIYRNHSPIFTGDEMVLSYVDSTGIPNTQVQYEVRTFRDNEQEKSLGVSGQIIYPDLPQVSSVVLVPDQMNMVDTVQWTYHVKVFDGFEIVLRVAEGTEKSKFIEAIPGQTTYEYVVDGILSGQSYTVDILPRATREETPYYGPIHYENRVMSVLPVAQLDVRADVNTNYSILNWTYPDLPIHGWQLTINAGSNNVVNEVLKAGERSYLYNTIASTSYTATLRALVNGGTTGEAATQGWTEESFNAANFAKITATSIAGNNALTNGIAVSVTNSVGTMRLYRDGQLIKSDFTGDYSFTDYSVNPGERYLYEVRANGGIYASAAEGSALGMNGQLSGSIKYTNGQTVGSGVPVRISGWFDERYVIDTVYTVGNGQYAKNKLPYSDQSATATTYRAIPLQGKTVEGDWVSHTVPVVYSPDQAEAELVTGLNASGFELFYDESSVTFTGQVRHALADIGSLEGSISLYNDPNGANELVTVQSTTNTRYTMSAPYDPDWQELALEYSPNAQTSGEEVYQYLEVQTLTFDASALTPGKTMVNHFIDTLLVPVNIRVMEGECNAIEDYTWKMFLTEVGGTYDTLIEMKGNVSLQLPAKNFEARMLDVTPLTSYSKSVLGQLLTELVSINLEDSLEIYRGDYDVATHGADETVYQHALDVNGGSVFVNQYAFTYLPGLLISTEWEADQSQFAGTVTSCSGGVSDLTSSPIVENAIDIIAMKDDPEQIDRNIYTLSVSANLNSAFLNNCGVANGYFIVKNNAGYRIGAKNDTLKFDNEIVGDWDNYTFEAGNINTSAPHTRAIEFNYYNANGKYVTTYMKTVIVTGAKLLEGTGFILDTQESLYPLYVLHDPPGDGSSAWIEKGTSLSYKIDKGFEYGANTGLAVKFGSYILGSTQKQTIDYSFHYNRNSGSSESLTVNFNERLSTDPAAPYHFESKKYLVGKSADIVVGLGVINKYGAARDIQVDAHTCKLSNAISITVQPDHIATQWTMTRNSLEEDSKYYQRLLDDANIESVGNGKDFTDADLQSRIDNIQQILFWHDQKYRVPVKVCELVDHISDNSTIAVLKDYNIYEDVEEIKKFCMDNMNKHRIDNDNNTVKDSNDGEYFMPGAYDEDGDFTHSWLDSDFEVFDEVMSRFQDLWTTYMLMSGGIWITEDNRVDALDEIEFDYLQNLSFSAGLSYSKSLSYTESNLNNAGFGATYSLKTKILSLEEKGIVHGSWSGVGSGFLVMGTNPTKVETGTHVEIGAKYSYRFTQIESKSKSFSLGYTLQDGDPGDEFNVWVMTDPTGHNYYSSPEFYLTSGQSSCPWEEGTIKRDDFKISLTDDDGNPMPSTVRVEGDELLVFKMKYENLSPLEEYRQGATTGGPNTGQNGETVMANGNFPIHPIFPSTFYTTGSEPEYFTATLSKLFAPAVKGTVVFRPYIGASCNVTDLAPDHTDFLELTMVFISPTSPISLPTARGNWLISNKLNSLGEDANRRLGIELNDLKIGNDLFQLDQVMVMARSTTDAQNDWVIIKDTGDKTTVTHEELIGGYSVFEWEPDQLDFPDGEYDLKGVVIGEEGGREESASWRGRIDLTKPFLVQAPQPADGLLSKGDVIGLTMNEDINAGKFMVRAGEIVTVEVYAMDSALVQHTVHYDSDYNFSELVASVNGAGLTLWLDESVLTSYDGHPVKVTVSGLQDLAGNEADDIAWWFKLDAFNWPVSKISMFVQNSVDDGGRFWLNAMDDRTGQSFYASNYDVYNKISMLDRVQLQFRTADGNPGSWLTLDERTMADLRDGNNGFTTDLSGNAEGTYDFRLMAWAGASSRASNIISATVDLTAPIVVSSPDKLEGVSQFGVTFSEAMKSQGNLSITASIGGQAFSALDGYVSGEKINFVIDTTHADYALLGNHYGYDLEINLGSASDLAGNALGDTLVIPIGNYNTTLSDILISDQNWVMNINNQAVTFTIDGYDLLTQDALDSIALVYRRTGAVNYNKIAGWDKADLLTKGAAFNHTWNILNEAQADGSYQVHAIVYGDGGKAFYSNPAEGVIDRTAPIYMNLAVPSTGTYDASNSYFGFTYSEALSADGVHKFTIGQVGGGNVIEIPSGSYHTVVDGKELRIIPSESFLSLYSLDTVEIYLGSLEDLNGNAALETETLRYIMYDYQPGSNIRQATELAGEALKSGEIELGWTSYQSFESSTLERSRNGWDFIDIATYHGELTKSHMDQVNFSSVIFYRLRQVSEDSTISYSKGIVIENDNRMPVLVSHAYPNPSEGEQFELSILTSNDVDEIQVEVFDVLGKVVYTKGFASTEVMHTNLVIEPKDPFEVGIYQVLITQGNKTSKHKLMVVPGSRP